MKRAVGFLFLALIMLHAAFVYADDIRIMVAPFGGGEGDDVVLNQKVAAICAKEAMHTKGFAYVPPGDFIREVTGIGGASGNGPLDVNMEYSAENARMLEDIMYKTTEKSVLLDFIMKIFGATDIIIDGTAVRDGSMVKVEVKVEPPMRLNADKEVDYSVIIKCEENRLEEVLREVMKQLLEKILKAGMVRADILSDPDTATVMYVLKGIDGRYIAAEMSYEVGVADPDIVSVDILPPEGIDENARTTIGVMSLEGKKIDVEFDYKAGNLEGVTIYAPRPEGSNGAGRSESFTLKSEVGYLLEFDFEWKDDDSVASVKIGPKVNPFTGLEEAAS